MIEKENEMKFLIDKFKNRSTFVTVATTILILQVIVGPLFDILFGLILIALIYGAFYDSDS